MHMREILFDEICQTLITITMYSKGKKNKDTSK